MSPETVEQETAERSIANVSDLKLVQVQDRHKLFPTYCNGGN